MRRSARRRWRRPPSPRSVVAFAAALRIVGLRLRASAAAPQPRRDEHRPARVGARPRRRARPRLVRLPEPPLSPARAVPDRARRAVVRDGAGRRDRDRPRRRRRGVVARAGRRTGVLAGLTGAVGVAVATTHVAYSRMAVTDVLLTARRDRVPGAARHGSARVGGGRRRARRVREVPRGAARRAAPRRRLRPVAQNRTSASRSPRAGFAVDEPVRARARGRRLGRRHAGQPPRTGGLARLRGRSCDAVRVRVAALGDGRAARPRGAGRRWSSPCADASDAISCSSRSPPCTALSLLPIEAHFDRYVLPLVPVALRARRRDAAARGRGARRVPRSALVVDRRHARRSPAATRASTLPPGSTAPCPRQETDRRRPVDAAAARDAHVIRLELPGPGRPFDPRRDLARAPCARAPLARRLGGRDRPRPRGGGRLPARGGLLPLSRDADPRVRRRGVEPRQTVAARLPHLPLSDGAPRDPTRRSGAGGRGVPLGGGAPRCRDRREPGARADVR